MQALGSGEAGFKPQCCRVAQLMITPFGGLRTVLCNNDTGRVKGLRSGGPDGTAVVAPVVAALAASGFTATRRMKAKPWVFT